MVKRKFGKVSKSFKYDVHDCRSALTYLTIWEQLIGKLLQHKKEIEIFSLITTKCSTASKGGWKN